MTSSNTTHTTIIDGKKYRLDLTMIDGKKSVWVRSVRVQEDGTEVTAFLSNRQWKAESRAKTRFAKEIAEFLKA